MITEMYHGVYFMDIIENNKSVHNDYDPEKNYTSEEKVDALFTNLLMEIAESLRYEYCDYNLLLADMLKIKSIYLSHTPRKDAREAILEEIKYSELQSAIEKFEIARELLIETFDELMEGLENGMIL